jgi:iron complex outermembrane recepter protein
MKLPLALIACVASAIANGADLTELDYLSDVPLVLSASRLRQPISETPVTMTIIDRATIEASGVREITELFRLVPGMYVRPGLGIEGVVPVVSYHGLTNEFARRMQVLIDGRSVYLPPFSTVLWDDLPISIDDIERIEVTRGPNAGSYGANAFFGTVNIITRSPVASEGAYALARAGQQGVREGVLRYANADESLSYRVSAGHKADNGFENLYDTQNHSYLTGRVDGQVDSTDSLQLQLGVGNGARELGIDTSAVNRPRTKDIDHEYAQLRWLRAPSSDEEISLQYAYERHANKEIDQTLPIPLPGPGLAAYTIRGDYRIDRHDLQFQQISSFSPQFRWVWGAGARVDQIDAPIYFGGRHDVTSNVEQLFVHGEWHASAALLLQGGGMLERTSIAGTDLSPRASVTYRFDADRSLRASISGATRTPSIFEAQGNFGLNFGSVYYPVQASGGDLRSERLVSTEIGYHASFAQQSGQFDLKVYRDHAMRMIDEYSDASLVNDLNPETLMKNVGDARVVGLEPELHLRLDQHTNILLSYAYTVISSIAAPGTTGYSRTMPRSLLGALAERSFDSGLALSAALYLNSGLPALTGVPGQSDQVATGFGRRLDLRAVQSLRVLGVDSKLAIGVQDALPAFEEFRPNTMFYRRAYVEVLTQR